MPRGGRRPGAGRPKGAKERALLATAEAKARTEGVVDDGLLPLEFLIEMYRDERNPMALRIDAAKAAAPYLHRKQPTELDVTATAAPTPPKMLSPLEYAERLESMGVPRERMPLIARGAIDQRDAERRGAPLDAEWQGGGTPVRALPAPNGSPVRRD